MDVIHFTEQLRLEWTSGGHLPKSLLKQGHLQQAAQDRVQGFLSMSLGTWFCPLCTLPSDNCTHGRATPSPAFSSLGSAVPSVSEQFEHCWSITGLAATLQRKEKKKEGYRKA